MRIFSRRLGRRPRTYTQKRDGRKLLNGAGMRRGSRYPAQEIANCGRNLRSTSGRPDPSRAYSCPHVERSPRDTYRSFCPFLLLKGGREALQTAAWLLVSVLLGSDSRVMVTWAVYDVLFAMCCWNFSTLQQLKRNELVFAIVHPPKIYLLMCRRRYRS